MLNKPVINQVHYVIFESMQFSNLYALTKDEFFKKQADLRRSMLQARYPIYRMGTGDDQRILFSMMGAPNPYSLDTYGIEIACSEKNGDKTKFQQLRQFKSDLPYSDRLFINQKFRLDQGTKCEVTANYEGMHYPIYSTGKFEQVEPGGRAFSVEYSSSAMLDAFEREGGIYVDPKRKHSAVGADSYLDTQGRLIFKFQPKKIDDNTLIGLEVTPGTDLPIGVLLLDGKKSAFRYYQPLKRDKKNLVLVSRLGFDGGTSLEQISELQLLIYTDKLEEVVKVVPGRVLFFDNQSELEPYFKENSVFINIK